LSEQELLSRMTEIIAGGDRDAAQRVVQQGLDAGLDPNRMLDDGLIPGIREAGDKWECGEYFLPELMMSARAMQAAMAILQPIIRSRGMRRKALGRVVIGTIQGDIHDIGKTLVGGMLSAAGFEIRDLGADVALERFIEQAEDFDANLICCSALLTTTMLNQKKLIELLTQRCLRERYKVMVGGAPVTQRWAEEIGADGYGDNAVAAVAVARRLLEAHP
jgi:corrinoid protein of di/trimethylamine methyltransferase